MASKGDVETLLQGALRGDPYGAFGLHRSLSEQQLKSECRRLQSMYHADRGNSTDVSQIANACASVLCGKDWELSDCIRDTARRSFQDLMRKQAPMSAKACCMNLIIDRVTSPKMVSQAELLVSTFDVVPRTQATPHSVVRKVLMRALNLTTVECGWLIEKAGLRRVTNSQGVKVTTTGQGGLKVPVDNKCCECLGRLILNDLIR